MFKNEIENDQKLKLNETFEFSDWDKIVISKKKLRPKKDNICQCRWMKIYDNCIEFR